MQGAKLTTLCHLERNGCYLMLHRVKKEEDVNKGKWIGVGGKFEPGESPEECLMREVREETGFILTGSEFRGILTFIYDRKDPEYIFVYTSRDFFCGNQASAGITDYCEDRALCGDGDDMGARHGEGNEEAPHDASTHSGNCAVSAAPGETAVLTDMPVPECDEGIFRWIAKEDVLSLALWEGDRYMLDYLLQDRREPFSLKLCYDAEDNLIEAWEMSASPRRLK